MTSDAPPSHGAPGHGYGAPGYGAPGHGASAQGPLHQDPPRQVAEPAHRAGFLTTLPGILTAVAAVITAVSGGLGIYLADRNSSDDLGQDAAEPPAATVPADPGRAAAENLDDVTLGDEVDALVDDCALGLADACATVMDVLVEGCQLGEGLSCDALYWISPVESAYEDYGATCGGRFDWTYVGACGEL